MSDDASAGRPQLPADASVEQIQADIARTRSELGETVNALSAKADVSGRAKEKVAGVKENVPVGAVAAGVAVAVLAFVLWRRRRWRR